MGFSVSFGQKNEVKTYSWEEILARPGIYKATDAPVGVLFVPYANRLSGESGCGHAIFLAEDGRCREAYHDDWRFKRFVVSHVPVTICFKE